MGIARSSVRHVEAGVGYKWPISIHPSGRYFVQANGEPFFFLQDAGWSAIGQLTVEQIKTYLWDRAARGFTATIIELPNWLFSNQQPTYANAYGDNPFSVINNTGSPYYYATTCTFAGMVEAYWKICDFYIAESKRLGMVVIAFPAYAGFQGTPAQGWLTPFMNTTAADLQAYGAALATRYGDAGNIIYGMSGDTALTQAQLDQQWNIVTGMRSVRTDQLIYVKGSRASTGLSLINANGGAARYPGFNVNNVYVANGSGSYTGASDSATAYGVSPAMIFFCDETDYEEYSGYTAQDIRNGLWTASPITGCSNACFGNAYLWSDGSPFDPGGLTSIGPAAALAQHMDTPGARHCSVYADIMLSRRWWDLIPTPALLTTSAGSGASVICPAKTSDGKEVGIYTASGSGFTLDLTQLAGAWSATWDDPTSGRTVAAGSGVNSGTQAFTTPGANDGGGTDWFLDLRAA